jgi:CHAT domain-containing protein
MPIVARSAVAVPILFLALAGSITRAAESPKEVPAAIERQVAGLQLAYQKMVEKENWDGALSIIREGLGFDGDHPVLWRLAVDLLRRKGDLAHAAGLLDSLGPSVSPGRLYAEGIVLFFGRKHAEAGGFFERALEAYARQGHAAGQAASHFALGNVESEKERYEDALRRYETAGGFLETIGDRLGMADVGGSIARLQRKMGKPRLAAERQRKVLALREQLDDKPGMARSWHEIGVCLLEDRDLSGAREALETALRMRRDLNDKAAEGTTLRMLAQVAAVGGDDPASLENLESAETAFAQTGDRRGRAENLAEMGTTLLRMGRFVQARTILESARPLAAALKDRRLEAAILADLGHVAGVLRDIPTALSATERSLAVRRELKDTRGEISCLDILASIHLAVGNLAAARASLESREPLAARLGNPDEIAAGDHNMGVVLGQMAEPESALEHFDRAGRLWRENGPEQRLDYLKTNRALVLLGQGRVAEARAALEDALAGFHRRHEERGQALALNQLGGLEAAGGRHLEASNRHTAALDLARRLGLAEEEWRAHIGLAGSLQARGRHEEAVEHALRAIEMVERVRAGLLGDSFKMRFLAGRMDLYERAISILLAGRNGRGPDAARALEVAERAKARGLLDLLGESRHRMREGLPADLKAREQAALDAVSAATLRLVSAKDEQEAAVSKEALERAEQDMARLEMDVRAASPVYARMVFPRPASLRDVQAALASDEVLLEYFIGKEAAWVWQVTTDKVSVQGLPPAETLRHAVAAFVEGAGSPGAALGGDRVDPAARRLAEMILPSRRGLPAGRLLVAPDGPLHHVAFDALVEGDRYLIEEREIAMVPSATAMVWMRSAAPSAATRAFLGVGEAPAGTDASLSLPWAREEVERIAALFKEPSRRVILGDKVSQAAMTEIPLSDFRYVHFATHGLLKEGAEGTARTGLWLGRAPGQEADAVLTLPEVATLRLDAELVVLSACRSGAGELLDGEGMVGLTRAFLHAGARAVVMTLWNVEDQSTVDLMESFYRRLGSGVGPAAALRQAKLEFIRSDRPARREPYRWAPFVLVGAATR